MSTEKETDGNTSVKDRHETKQPRKFVVILHNDDFTSMEIVIEILLRYFEKNILEAGMLMYSVHEKGSANAGVYTREIAETKVDQATKFAREKQCPLKITMQPE